MSITLGLYCVKLSYALLENYRLAYWWSPFAISSNQPGSFGQLKKNQYTDSDTMYASFHSCCSDLSTK